jgi:hypothetical protein
MIQRQLVTLMVVGLTLVSCAQPEQRAQNDFYRDMQKVKTEMLDVQSLVNSNQFAKVRYTERVNQMVPATQELLRKYQGKPQESEPSYQSLKKAFEHYVMADHLWKQDKGLVIVNQRLAEAEQELQSADQSLKDTK